MTAFKRPPVSDEELEQWAKTRADDAGHLARELIALRRADPEPRHRALIDAMNERDRQHNEEGWTPEHHDQHAKGQLAAAAACYAGFSDAYPNSGQPPFFWPFEGAWWKPSNYRRDLVKAAALILAEIERIDRAEAAKP